MSGIQILDCTALGLDKQDGDISESDYRIFGSRFLEILSTDGYVYLTNCQLDKELIEKAMNISGKFFDLPVDKKKKYVTPPKKYMGWFGNETESVNPNAPPDLKESYNALPINGKWPDDEVPGFRDTTISMYKTFEVLAWRVVRTLALALDLDDPDFFVKYHQQSTGNLRYLIYHPVTESEIKPGQLRCADHTDFGTLTFSVQDDAGGLQLRTQSGEWLDATPVEGAILVYGGDLLQRWTTDRIVSRRHRVVIPENGNLRPRRSLIYFLYPDFDTVVSCLDGSDKYKAVTAFEYAQMKFADISIQI